MSNQKQTETNADMIERCITDAVVLIVMIWGFFKLTGCML